MVSVILHEMESPRRIRTSDRGQKRVESTFALARRYDSSKIDPENPHIATAHLILRDVQMCVDQSLQSVKHMQELIRRSRKKIVYCWRHVLSKPRVS